MSANDDPLRMTETQHMDGGTLLAEAIRYLAAIEVFRNEGREPAWRAEQHEVQPGAPSAQPARQDALPVHGG